MTIHTAARAATAAATALLASACGTLDGVLDAGNEFTEQGPRAIAKAAFTEMRSLESLRLLGTADTETGPTRVDVHIDRDSCVGTFDGDDGTFEIVKNGTGAWFKADASFWRSNAGSAQRAAAVIRRFSDKWVVLEGKNKLAGLCDLDELLGSFTVDKEDKAAKLGKGEIEKIGDIDAIPIDGRDDDGERVTVWVAVEAPHYVVKMAPTRPNALREELYFQDFGVEVDAQSPPKKDIIRAP